MEDSSGSASRPEHSAAFEALGCRFRIASDRADLLRPFEHLFANFRITEGVPGQPLLALQADRDDGPALLLNGRPFEIPGGGDDLVAHAYAVLLHEVFSNVEGFFLLHGAALRRAGRGLVLCGASGSGKTSLAWTLARGGSWELLSDDVAPLDVVDGRLHPFPKGISLRAGLIPADALEGEPLPVLEGGVKRIVDPRQHGLGVAEGSCELGTLVFLEPDARPLHPDTAPLAVVIHRSVPGLLGRLAELPGVHAVRERAGTRFVTLDIQTKVPARTLGRVEELCRDEGVLIIGIARQAQRAEPDFDSEPELLPLSLDESVRLFLRRLWGVAQYRLVASMGGGARLYITVARMLDGVRCYRLRPGRFEQELELLERATQAR